jgi:sulfide:quinone oxidoreductase
MAAPQFAPSVDPMSSTPYRVLIAGGGVAGIEALLTLHALAGDRLELTMADAAPDFVYRPLAVAEPFARDQVRRYPLRAIADDANATLVPDTIVAVDDDARVALTEGGRRLRYDALLLATGARSVPAYQHALNWDEQSGTERLGGLLRDIEQGYVHRIAFVVPAGPGWPLPVYELALLTAHQAFAMQMKPQITIVTPEVAPLAVFGPRASAAVKDELRAAGIGFHGCAYADVEKGNAATVVLHPGMRRIDVDRVVALPRLVGRAPDGVPADSGGFLPVDEHGRVRGTDGIWAAGDGISFPVKFGGLAAEQADAASESIAAAAGVAIEPAPFRPVLRGQLLLGHGTRFMHHVSGGGDDEGTFADHTLWWPPGKVAGKRLAPYIAERDDAALLAAPHAAAGLAIQTDLVRELQAAPTVT